jgi:hypothetical protein
MLPDTWLPTDRRHRLSVPDAPTVSTMSPRLIGDLMN